MFWWLFEHHDALIERLGGNRISWKGVCEQLAGMGLTDRNGRPPNPCSARKTWFRVRKAVEERAWKAAQSSGRGQARFPIPRSDTALPRLSAPVAPMPVVMPDLSPASIAVDDPAPAVSMVATPVTTDASGVVEQVSTSGDVAAAEQRTAPVSPLAPPAVMHRPSAVVDDDEANWTPEQRAHVEAEISKNRAECRYIDRFNRL